MRARQVDDGFRFENANWIEVGAVWGTGADVRGALLAPRGVRHIGGVRVQTRQGSTDAGPRMSGAITFAGANWEPQVTNSGSRIEVTSGSMGLGSHTGVTLMRHTGQAHHFPEPSVL